MIRSNNFDLSPYEPSVVQAYNLPGQGQIGIPFAVFPSFVYFNKDLFDEAGLPYPPQRFGEPYQGKEWNFDTLRDLSKQLTVDEKGNEARRSCSPSSWALPQQVTIVPTYALFTPLGWVGTWLPVLVPHFFGNASNVFLLRQFFMSIPREMDEAAMIDGAGPFLTSLSVIVPQAWPAIIAVRLFHFFFAWNDFLARLVYLVGHEECGQSRSACLTSVPIQAAAKPDSGHRAHGYGAATGCLRARATRVRAGRGGHRRRQGTTKNWRNARTPSFPWYGVCISTVVPTTHDDMKTVLIVDDDAWLREMLTWLLVDEGFWPLEARNGLETVQLACELKPDLILLDAGLPGRSGLQVLEDLRKARATRDIPVMLVSGEINLFDCGQAHNANAMFHKPLDFAAFLSKIHEATATSGQGPATTR